MSWQKTARLAIAAFVLVFAVIVVLALRQRKQPAAAGQAPARKDSATTAETGRGVNELVNKEGKVLHNLTFESSATYPHGRKKLLRITLTLPDRGNRTVVVTADRDSLVGVGVGRKVEWMILPSLLMILTLAMFCWAPTSWIIFAT